MADELVKQWEVEAPRMRGRKLTSEENAAIEEEVLRGNLQPHLSKRPMKNTIRRAIDSVRPRRKAHA